MAIIKCKMCGGDITLSEDRTFGTCDFCGSTMTFPKFSDEQRINAFNRGNHFRRVGEFDKALSVYEQIIREDNTDAEAHWCAAISRFGIEYVEDPISMEYIPTCHRASYDSFLDDVDFIAALEYSDGITKRQYQKDGNKIAEVQKAILATSSTEEPFDIFICYKESDESNDRTPDSVIAQEIYYQLENEGFKVFFSRITLEEIVGTEYEPYIFSALNSAKVMVVIGTSKENLDAVWVKNEWSRFLALMKKDRSKVLLPCYRDMSPYDMPEALSVLQAYDISKIGFMQDLIRGIKKIITKEASISKTSQGDSNNNANTLKLLKEKLASYAENDDYDKVIIIANQIIELDHENIAAYRAKTLAECKIRTITELHYAQENFSKLESYQMLLILSDEAGKQQLRDEEIKWNDLRKEKRKVVKKKLIIAGCAVALLIIAMIPLIIIKTYNSHYYEAIELSKAGKYDEALDAIFFEGYARNRDPKLFMYIDAGQKYNEGDYIAARQMYIDLNEYLDSKAKISSCDTAIEIDNFNTCIENKDVNGALKIAENMRKADYDGWADLYLAAIPLKMDSDMKGNNYAVALINLVKYKDLGVPCDNYINDLVNKFDSNIQNLYHGGYYSPIKSMCSTMKTKNISMSSTVKNYNTLAMAHSSEVDNSTVNELKSLIGTEDAAELLVSNDSIAIKFLQGSWKGDGYYLAMQSNGYISYDLPWFNYGDYYAIVDGVVWLYKKTEPIKSGKQLFRITVNSANSITVYAYKNGGTYVLTRQ